MNTIKPEVATLLRLARQALDSAHNSRTEGGRSECMTVAHTYFASAWVVAGGPRRVGDWDWRTWSARELLAMADSDDAMYCEDVGAGPR